MKACFICNEHQVKNTPVLAQNESMVLTHIRCTPQDPKVYRGHLLVEPKRHVITAAELDESEAAELGQLLALGSRMLMDKLGAEHVYSFNLGVPSI